MSNSSTRAILCLFGLALAHPVQASVETILSELIGEAERANLELVGYEAGVAGRLAVLDQARARFLPALDLAVRYSRADGGRQLEIPVGDLLNPVYSSLNSLLAASGQPAPFQPIANQSIPLLREQEQETVLRLTQPLYDARIPAVARVAGYEYDAARHGYAALRARVRRDVQQAYYRWLGVVETRRILEASLESAGENLRVNDSLHRNGKVTRDRVLRAEVDVLELEQQLVAAGGGERIARHYVNLLRNTALEAPLPGIAVDDADVARLRDQFAAAAGTAARDGAALQGAAVDRRAELRQLDAGLEAAGAAADVARAAFKPQLDFALNAGSQGEQFRFGEDDRFVLASLVLRFNFFRGGADQAALREARALSSQLRATRELAEQQVRLEVLDAVKDFQVAEASLLTAAKRVEAAAGAYQIIRRKRDLGQVPPVEFIDARRALTSAQISQNVSRLEALSALAAVEYAVGTALLETRP